jgi:outer membrane protein OmpA-like peptidoglycan-associated protein
VGQFLCVLFEHAVRIIDGDVSGFPFVSRALADTVTEFVYELPALTTFTRFTVPEVRETPSPAQTFTRVVEIHGSASGPTDGYTLLGSATLLAHAARGDVTEIPIVSMTPVRWVRLRLVGGIDVRQAQSFLEFSEIRGVRSSNGGPFRLYQGPSVAAGAPGAQCPPLNRPVIGCDAVIHGITFGFDSAVIRPESAPVLDELFKNLQADPRGRIVIEGHTSSEGAEAYNERLSQQRAESVRADLVRRGLADVRVTATGLGESTPIASSADENGRSINRRVAVTCQ